MIRRTSSSALFPYTTLFRSVLSLFDGGSPLLVACMGGLTVFWHVVGQGHARFAREILSERERALGELARSHEELKAAQQRDRKSTRLNSSHGYISYAVFCLK